MKKLIKLLCVSEVTDDYEPVTEQQEVKESKWEDYRGAIIFWSIAAFLTIFVIIPWLTGMGLWGKLILSWIF
jgi:hypothetical protein